jgi:hypothetical protein
MTNRVFMGLFGSVGPTRPRVQSWAHLGFENNNFPNMHKIIILYIYIIGYFFYLFVVEIYMHLVNTFFYILMGNCLIVDLWIRCYQNWM